MLPLHAAQRRCCKEQDQQWTACHEAFGSCAHVHGHCKAVPDMLLQWWLQVIRMVGESQETVSVGGGSGSSSNKMPTLEEYGTNLTTQATEVTISPVFSHSSCQSPITFPVHVMIGVHMCFMEQGLCKTLYPCCMSGSKCPCGLSTMVHTAGQAGPGGGQEGGD